ncbi:MAG: OsmC family protein [Burkholderiales bacterium]|mgnify:CR=1 FL=1|nr:OsmC family protein [Burkholderiales bacterium]OJX06665.1 MAG: peroxiredoxin [Burkholderiales bacterium 70-64]
MSAEDVTVRLAQRHDYQFEVDFGAGTPALLGDEPPPLGQGAGPSPMQLLASAVGNCLSSSLLFALRKFKQAPEPMTAEVTAEIGRNAENRLRVLRIRARLTLGVPGAGLAHLDRVLGQFEQFCTVTQSVAAGIPVSVEVFDSEGTRLK